MPRGIAAMHSPQPPTPVSAAEAARLAGAQYVWRAAYRQGAEAGWAAGWAAASGGARGGGGEHESERGLAHAAADDVAFELHPGWARRFAEGERRRDAAARRAGDGEGGPGVEGHGESALELGGKREFERRVRAVAMYGDCASDVLAAEAEVEAGFQAAMAATSAPEWPSVSLRDSAAPERLK